MNLSNKRKAKDHKSRLKVNNLMMKIEAKAPRITKQQGEKVEAEAKKLCKKVGLWRLKRLSMTKNLYRMQCGTQEVRQKRKSNDFML